ncbi:MAG: superoxide dismutase family protein [Clostridiaceae bacterium]|nr:superoxide dismutase family protein [Clostridiaceae bacterium]
MSVWPFYKLPLCSPPNAYARVSGSPQYPGIYGTIRFYQTGSGVYIVAQIKGLPQGDDKCASNIFGFHVHQKSPCSGTSEDPFANVGPHYNPEGCPHPAHAGDLPPLFGNKGCAFMSVLTDRFTVDEIIGRSVIIHGSPDDFTTQPSGDSGIKIACGQIFRNT